MRKYFLNIGFFFAGFVASWIVFKAYSPSRVDYVKIFGGDYLDYSTLELLSQISREYYSDYGKAKVIKINIEEDGYRIFLNLEGLNSASAWVLVGNSSNGEDYIVMEHGRVFY